MCEGGGGLRTNDRRITRKEVAMFENRKSARVVDMRMREKHRVDRLGAETTKIGKLPTAALIQPAVDEIGPVGDFDLIAAPAYLAGSAPRMNNEWGIDVNEFVRRSSE